MWSGLRRQAAVRPRVRYIPPSDPIVAPLHQKRLYCSNREVGGDGTSQTLNGWKAGNDGFQWKERYLNERRAIAHEYLGDINKREPIHDAIRTRAILAQQRLRQSQKATEVASQPRAADALTDAMSANHAYAEQSPYTDQNWAAVMADRSAGQDLQEFAATMETNNEPSGNDEAEEALLCEGDVDAYGVLRDTLAYVPEEYIELLAQEMYRTDNDVDESTNELLRKWLKLRKEKDQIQNFSNIPVEQRHGWNPWYLRDHTK